MIKSSRKLPRDYYKSMFIPSSAGSYGDNADFNVVELNKIMKNIIIDDHPYKTHAAVWATGLDKSVRKVDHRLRQKEEEYGRTQVRNKLELWCPLLFNVNFLKKDLFSSWYPFQISIFSDSLNS
ncbi:hypothetical protein Plhal703r1_c09g0047861 [Plasmopara halstedii]